MDEPGFWGIIALLDMSGDEDDDVIAQAVDALTKMDLKEILDFEEILAAKLYALDAEVYARGTTADGSLNGLSGDGFLYSRCAVVGLGQAYYESVLAEPVKMPKDLWLEPLLFVGPRAYETQTGEEFDHITRVSYETGSNDEGWRGAEG